MASDFIEWIKSEAGCDGGNPKARTWLCGIEWGIANLKTENDRRNYYNSLKAEIERGRPDPVDKFDLKAIITAKENRYAYSIAFAKLYAVIIGSSVNEYEKVASECHGDEIYKLNLFPVAFRDVDNELWRQYELIDKTGVRTKEEYKQLCREYRFPAFSNFTKNYNPELVICTGTSCRDDFFSFFAGEHISYFSGQIADVSPTNSRPRTYYWASINNNRTKVFIIPFFNKRYGLNSNLLIEKMGNEIQKIRGENA
jgi:hypothetical protein